MTSLLVYLRCKTTKKVLEKTNCKFVMTNRNKPLSQCQINKTLEEGN